MRRKNRRIVLIGVVGLALLIVATVNPQNDGDLMAMAVIQVTTVDDTYSGNLSPDTIYLSRGLFSSSSFVSGQLPIRFLDDEEVAALERRLAAAGIIPIWIDDDKSVPRDSEGGIAGGGVIVTLSPIYHGFLTSEVEASIYKASLAAGGTRYVFIQTPFGWRLWSSEMTWIS